MCLLFFSNGCATKVALNSISPAGAGATYYLPKGLVTIEVFQSKSNPAIYALEIKTSEIVPDFDQGFRLNYEPSAFHDDIVKIERTKNGLLSKIEFSAEDKTDDIILKVIDTGIEIAKLPFTPYGIPQEGVEYTKMLQNPNWLVFTYSLLNRVHQSLAKPRKTYS